MSESKKAWWTIPDNAYNQGWQIPTFYLGEPVWWRSDPHEGVHVTGIALQDGWQDDEANEWHEPYWQFQVTGKYGWWTEESFFGRAEHGAYLKAWVERAEAAMKEHGDFDPFLDSYYQTLP